jgi:oxygen tolerance protein BatD
MVIIRQWLLSIIALILISVNAQAAKIEVSVDRNPVAINDSFQLAFSTTSSPDDDPDFSPLKQDFEILNQQQSNQSSWINGKSTKSIKWLLTVMAKRSGNLTVPAINFGDDQSSPLALIVKKATSQQNKKTEDIFLDVEVSPKQVYVQSQVLYTVRFYQRVQIAQATLSEPKINNAIVENLEGDKSYNTQIKGVNYRVTERSYAIFPQQSGVIKIPPLVLSAQLIINDPNSRANSFFNMPNTQTKRITSEAITLNVLPSPDNFTGQHWLPAKQLQLQQSWSNKDLKVNVGEPLTRTITMLAFGITAGQLPDLDMQQTDSQLKIYPDQAIRNDQKKANGIMAIREQKAAFIPSSPGVFELPAIEIPWFNTQTNKMEVATLPAVTITAIGQIPNTINIAGNDGDAQTTPRVQSEEHVLSATQSPVWKWIAFALAIGWLLTILYLVWSRFKTTQTKPIKQDDNLALKTAVKTVKQACLNNDASACQQALITWGKIKFNSANLAVIKSYCDGALQNEIADLQQSLYAQDKNTWQGEQFLTLFMKHNHKSASKLNDDTALEPLYRT